MLSKDYSVNDLIALIGTSDDEKIRKKSLRFLIKSQIHNDTIFNLLENLIKSNENPFLKCIAIKEIYRNYKSKSGSLLKYAIENQDSPIVMQTIARLLIFDKSSELNEVFNLLKNRLCMCNSDLKVSFVEGLVLLSLDNYFLRKHPNFRREVIENRIDCYIDLDIVYFCTYKNPPPNSFPIKHVTKLSLINSKKIKLRYIPYCVKYFTQLISLNLFNCELKHIPEFVIKMKNLEHLHLEKNIPSNSKQVSESILNFVKNKIAPKYIKMGVIDSEAFALGVLEIFSDKFEKINYPNSDLRIEESSKSFFKINKNGSIEILYLRGFYNPIINFVPDLIADLKNLKILDLALNSLSEIPITIFKLKNLEYLDLSNNNIKEIPEDFVKLESLKFLNLGWNQIIKVPDAILKMKSLVGLELFYQRINTNLLNHEKKEIYNPIKKRTFKEVKENFTSSQQLLFYHNFLRCKEIEEEYYKNRDNLYKNASNCKHERVPEIIYPYTLFCKDCKETLELWKYGLHYYYYFP